RLGSLADVPRRQADPPGGRRSHRHPRPAPGLPAGPDTQPPRRASVLRFPTKAPESRRPFEGGALRRPPAYLPLRRGSDSPSRPIHWSRAGGDRRRLPVHGSPSPLTRDSPTLRPAPFRSLLAAHEPHLITYRDRQSRTIASVPGGDLGQPS